MEVKVREGNVEEVEVEIIRRGHSGGGRNIIK